MLVGRYFPAVLKEPYDIKDTIRKDGVLFAYFVCLLPGTVETDALALPTQGDQEVSFFHAGGRVVRTALGVKLVAVFSQLLGV